MHSRDVRSCSYTLAYATQVFMADGQNFLITLEDKDVRETVFSELQSRCENSDTHGGLAHAAATAGAVPR